MNSLEDELLEDFQQDLEGFLMLIASSGHENKPKWIWRRLNSIEKRYGHYLEHITSEYGEQLLDGYHQLGHFLTYSPEERKEQAEAILNECILPQEYDEIDENNPFYEYFQQ